jgi:hypothetical protein
MGANGEQWTVGQQKEDGFGLWGKPANLDSPDQQTNRFLCNLCGLL